MPSHRVQVRGANSNHQYIADAHQRINKIEFAVVRQGLWNPNINIPPLFSNGRGGKQGDYYVVSVDGTYNIDGISAWTKGDWIIHGGSFWEKVNNASGGGGPSAVLSVNGKTGHVVIDKNDVGLGNVDNVSVSTILDNSQLTGKTNVEYLSYKLTTYLGAGPHDIEVDGSAVNSVIHNGPSSIILPDGPANSSFYTISNDGTGNTVASPQGSDTIDTPAGTVTLFPGETAQFLYIFDTWKLV